MIPRLVVTMVLVISAAALYAQDFAKVTIDSEKACCYSNGSTNEMTTTTAPNTKPKSGVDIDLRKMIDNLNAHTQLRDTTVFSDKLVEGRSRRLAKQFKTENKIEAKCKIETERNKARLRIDWQIFAADAQSNFGYIEEGCAVVFELENGKRVKLEYGACFAPKKVVRDGYTNYSTSLNISSQDLKLLAQSKIRKTVMKWRTNNEQYNVCDEAFFVNTIPHLIKH